MISDRRDFLKSLMRKGLLGSMGFLSFSLITRHEAESSGFHCPPEPSCQQCGRFSDCDLPQADAVREITIRKSDVLEETHGKSRR